MANIISISIGVVTTAVRAGLAGLRTQFTQLRSFANSELGGALVGGGLVASLAAIIEKAARLKEMSMQFGALPEVLQRMANAAAPKGGQIEDIAQAYNKLSVNQNRVRKGDEEMRKSLDDLGISTQDFINAGSDEAMMKIADAVHGASDETKAYGAVVDILGRKAGVLFSTLQMGSKGIEDYSRKVGEMSNETIDNLYDVNENLKDGKNNIMAFGGAVLSFFINVAKTIGAVLGGVALLVESTFARLANGVTNLSHGQIKAGLKDFGTAALDAVGFGKDFKDSFTAGAQEVVSIWTKKSAKPTDRGGHRTVEDLDNAVKIEKEIKRLQAENQETADKINRKDVEGIDAKVKALMEEKELYDAKARAAGAAGDGVAREENFRKALEYEMQAIDLRKAYDKEYAEKRKQTEKDIFKDSLEGLTDNQKIMALMKRRDMVGSQIPGEKDAIKQLDLMAEKADLQREITGLVKKPQTVSVGNLGKIGGGGLAYLNKGETAEERAARSTEQTVTQLKSTNKKLDEIKAKTGEGARWKP